MTVKELQDKLTHIPPDATVVLEGCDCTGDWNGEIVIQDTDHRLTGPRKEAVLCRD